MKAVSLPLCHSLIRIESTPIIFINSVRGVITTKKTKLNRILDIIVPIISAKPNQRKANGLNSFGKVMEIRLKANAGYTKIMVTTSFYSII